MYTDSCLQCAVSCAAIWLRLAAHLNSTRQDSRTVGVAGKQVASALHCLNQSSATRAAEKLGSMHSARCAYNAIQTLHSKHTNGQVHKACQGQQLTQLQMGLTAARDSERTVAAYPLLLQAVKVPCRKGLAFWSYIRSCRLPIYSLNNRVYTTACICSG